MVNILVLYYSRTKNTEALANVIAEGASRVKGVTVSIKRVDYATMLDLSSCDAVAFGSPNYFGYMAGLMKDFFDRAWAVRNSLGSKPAAAFTSGGGSSVAALNSLENMIKWLKFEKVSEGIVSIREPSDEDQVKGRRLGKALAEAALEKLKAKPNE